MIVQGGDGWFGGIARCCAIGAKKKSSFESDGTKWDKRVFYFISPFRFNVLVWLACPFCKLCSMFLTLSLPFTSVYRGKCLFNGALLKSFMFVHDPAFIRLYQSNLLFYTSFYDLYVFVCAIMYFFFKFV